MTGVHVTPLWDVVDHELADDCVCGPECIPVERDDGSVGYLYRHHALVPPPVARSWWRRIVTFVCGHC